MAVNLSGQLLNLFLAFASRMILVRFLSVEYLGVNGLFGNILTLLSLSELGIGTAMVYCMYKPAALHDTKELTELINLYRRLYRIVAVIVAGIGIALIPFLGILIKDGQEVEHLRLYYVLFLAQSVSSYLFTYKTSLFLVHQKQYINNLYTYGFTLIRYVAQILFLYLTRNFTIYLVIQLGTTVLSGYLAAWHAERMYPYIKEDRHSLPQLAERMEIYKNIRAMAIHKLGDVVINYTDNLLISAFIGLSSVGIYSNYKLISTNLNHVIYQMISSFNGSIGNLGALESKEKIYSVYKTLNFMQYVCYGYCTAAMWVLFTPFITMGFGEEFLLPVPVVILLLVDFYTKGMRMATLCFRDAMGIFWYDRYKPILEIVINLTVSLVGVVKYGIGGVLAGTVASFFMVSFWVEPLVLFRFGIGEKWKKKLGWYFVTYVCYAGVLLLAGAAAWFGCRWIADGTICRFLLKGVLGSVIYFAVTFLCLGWTEECRSLIAVIAATVRGRRRRAE